MHKISYFISILIEKHIVLEDIDPVVFYGVGNAHLQMVRALFPKLRIVARDNVMRVLGDEEQMAAFEESTEKMPARAEVQLLERRRHSRHHQR